MKLKTNNNWIKTFCIGFAMVAGLFSQAAHAQATTAVVRFDHFSCSTNAGLGAFFAASWTVTVDPSQRVPPVITLTKPLDGCSAALYKAFSGPKGSSWKTASITVRDSKGAQLEYIGFGNATITGYSMNGGASIPTETIALAFTDLSIQW